MKKFLSLKRTVATLTPLLLSFPLIAINTNLSYATSLTVSARISEATCAIQVNSGATGVADLGEWVYSKTATLYQTMPVIGDGGTYNAASSTVKIDPNCPTIGLAALSMKFPASSAPEAENLKTSLKYGVATAGGPTFVITSQDGKHAFPIWAEVAAASSYQGTLKCGTHGDGLKLHGFTTGKGIQSIFIDSAGNTYTSAVVSFNNSYTSPGSEPTKFVSLPAGGSSLAVKVLTSTGTGANFTSVVPLASGQEVTCIFGAAANYAGNYELVLPTQPVNVINFKFKFTGPRQIPSNGWADPAPAPGTEFNGTIILSMSYN